MLKKVSDYVAKWHMLEQGDKVVVGVSGGADSVCLLFVLKELQKSIPFEIIVVHVNHGLRGADADADEAYVKRLCEENDILCITYFENVESIAKKRKQSIEEAGREVRRKAFFEVMEKYQATKIALAHHKNDNVETFFMNLARGSGLKGLGGIQPVAQNVIRPLLCVERCEIEKFLEERQITYCTDASNASDDYTRNRLRNHLIPFMEKEINECAVSHISETMEQMWEIQKFLEVQRDIYMQNCVKKREDEYVILENEFQTVPKVLQSLILKEVLVKTAEKEKDITAVHVKALGELFAKQTGRKLDLPYAVEAGKSYEGIVLKKKERKLPKENFYQEISFEDANVQEVIWEDRKIICSLYENTAAEKTFPQNSSTKYFDYDIIRNSLCIRTRQPGDYITIHPDGRTQKLKAYFINEKISQKERDKILLAADGNHILWIVGYRTNCIYQADRNTTHVLEIQINSEITEGESHGRNS